ncbi:hypothetical protein ACIPW5_36985 [Streptomyces sp. NPDC090077]|uniref:hypothetical protein n=1 Tax=Streptomyces sp. NPDC090077 TaxID=3365938 RepID=UPI003804DAB6
MIGRRIFVGVAGMAGVVALAVPAQAVEVDVTQEWGVSASYRPSKDFIPRGPAIRLGTKGCTGGAATSSRTELVKTSTQSAVYNGIYFNITGGWVDSPEWVGVDMNSSYYLRWYGNGGKKAPCQGVSAIR